MTKPTETQFEFARVQGAAARRGGRKLSDNPYRHGSTEPSRSLYDAWADGYRREMMRRLPVR